MKESSEDPNAFGFGFQGERAERIMAKEIQKAQESRKQKILIQFGFGVLE